MYSVQLAVGNAPYSAVLSEILAYTETCRVTAVDRPDLHQPGVLVLSEQTLDSLPLPLDRPERVVLITSKAPKRLAHAWKAGIRCVIFDSDPPRTMALAIIGAALRVRSPNALDSPANIPHSSVSSPASHPKVH